MRSKIRGQARGTTPTNAHACSESRQDQIRRLSDAAAKTPTACASQISGEPVPSGAGSDSVSIDATSPRARTVSLCLHSSASGTSLN